jgi:dihydroorotate dehydrogenase
MIYKGVVKPILFRFDPEFIHDNFTNAGAFFGSNPLTRGVLRANYRYDNPVLYQNIHGITFHNPVGLAAGFDKDCRLMKILPAIGFGFEEDGSITAEPYDGNPKPRLVRLPKDQSIIVYYGLKNKGAKAIRNKFIAKSGKPIKYEIPIGISVAKTNKHFHTQEEKIADWIEGLRLMKDCGDYITINVSCPNTTDPQNFCDPTLLKDLLDGIARAKLAFDKPVFLKLSADISMAELDRIIKHCDSHTFIKGFVLTNLVKDRTKLELKSDKSEYEPHKGGLSGKVVFPYSLALVRHAYEKAGDRYIIIGCGGIFTAEDAYAYIRNGASLVQLVTGLIFGGPSTIKEINQGLVKLLKRDGYKTLSEAIGADVKNERAQKSVVTS